MKRILYSFLAISLILGMLLPIPLSTSFAAAPKVTGPVTFTILHTNDFHGTLENKAVSSSNPGAARVAYAINQVRTSVGEPKVLLLDGGDIMQGSLLSNLNKGEPTINYYKQIGYDATTLGNHEFDWGKAVLADRALQAADSGLPGSTFPMLSANVVVNDTGNCSTAGWTHPVLTASDLTSTYTIEPYAILDVATGAVHVGVIGVSSVETPYITMASATDSLCFKDPANSILRYYDEMIAAGAEVIVVLSHNGFNDGGYGYGFPVYGDKTLAQKLIDAGKPANLIIGGHSHTDMSSATKVGNTTIVQAYYNGRALGRADISYDPSANPKVTITWSKIVPNPSGTADPTINALITSYTSNPAYQAIINQPIGYTQVDLKRNSTGDDMMGAFLQDSLYKQLNGDADLTNDVDMVFNNPGGVRADLCAATCTDSGLLASPFLLTYGMMYSVLPFGNQTAIGDMKGGDIIDLLNQSAMIGPGNVLDIAGIRHKFFSYKDALPGPQPWAWGAYDIEVYDKNSSTWKPIDANETYRVATNEFLAPAGQDGFIQFKYMTNITYWGDMLNLVDTYVSANYATTTTAYKGPNGNGTLDGRIYRNGTNTTGTVIPVTILHHNDSHGNLVTGPYAGYPQLVTLINQNRAHNPTRTLLLSSGDNIQGDGLSNYFKDAHQGYSSDGLDLPAALQIMPLIKAFNSVGYDAMVLGNHEFNFGAATFAGLTDANFPILQANILDNGSYGIAGIPVEPYVSKTVGSETIRVAILGLGNPRVPNYELPSNILGLTFTDPIASAQSWVPTLASKNDVVIALTHIGLYDTQDTWHDVTLAESVDDIDVIIGGHTHTDPASATSTLYPTPFKFLPGILGSPDGSPVLITQALRYNGTLGTVVVGLLPSPTKVGAYDVVSTAGRYEKVVYSSTNPANNTPEDTKVKAVIDPYNVLFTIFNNTVIGQTDIPIKATTAYTEETNGANLQADASVWKLRGQGNHVDFHLSGAMTNKDIALAATPANPVTLKIADMFTLMPYENSLVVLSMNGPQLKTVLERAYLNYYNYKYVTGHGTSYYTTCMIDIDANNHIVYNDRYPDLPNGNNVAALTIGGVDVDFGDTGTYYNVSTVNYLAAGSCNFNNAGVSLWPLNQIVADTQFYVRDVVIDYIKYLTATFGVPIHPVVEGRLVFGNDRAPVVSDFSKDGVEDTDLLFSAADFIAAYTDPQADPLAKIVVTTLPSSTAGVLKLSGTAVTVNQVILVADLGNLVFVPAANWNGTATFKWKGNDGTYSSIAAATVTMNIAAVNDWPVAVDDVYSVVTNGGLTVPAPGVLGNDIDPDLENQHYASLLTAPTNGDVTLFVDGSFTYIPDAGFIGDDSFEYNFISTPSKGGPFIDTATVTIHVTASKAPRIPDQSAFGGEAFALAVDPSAFDDVDPALRSELTLTATLADGKPLPAWLTFDPATVAFSGTPANNDAGLLDVMVIATDLTGSFVTNGYQITVTARTFLPMINR
jgi:2',3'-cyclic-nucleotide 2'-phosphodiesterase (5'-nucleotidase family)